MLSIDTSMNEIYHPSLHEMCFHAVDHEAASASLKLQLKIVPALDSTSGTAFAAVATGLAFS